MRTLLLFLTVLVSGHIYAAPLSPEAIAYQVLEGYRTQDYKSVMAAMDPKELSEFSAIARPIFLDSPSMTPNLFRAGMFGNGVTDRQLAEMSDLEFAARFCEGQMTLLARRDNVPLMPIQQFSVLGHVLEPPNLAHVVLRVTVANKEFPDTVIRPLTLRSTDGEWKALLDDGTKAFARKLRADFDR